MNNRGKTLAAAIELAAVYVITYAQMPESQRREVRMWWWLLVQKVSSRIALLLGRVAISAELNYRSEVAGVS